MRARIGDLASTALANRGKMVKASTWQAYAIDVVGYTEVQVWHYSTLMLRLRTNDSWGLPDEVQELSVGWGSVSDQQGMNQILRDLNLPLYYRRDAKGGGPRYERLES